MQNMYIIMKNQQIKQKMMQNKCQRVTAFYVYIRNVLLRNNYAQRTQLTYLLSFLKMNYTCLQSMQLLMFTNAQEMLTR